MSPAVLEAERRRVQTIERISRSTVCVFSRAGDNGGSGVLISSDGEALTNFHVIAGLGPFVKCGLSDGTINWAVVVGADPTGDVALIRLLGTRGEFRDDFIPATIGDSDEVAVGDTAFVVGNPFLLATNLQPTVTAGVISGVKRYQYPAGTFLEYTECFQTDASINPGNSGGPMFNAAGELIGINGRASFEKRGRVFTGAGYAISINQAKRFLDHLRSGRIVDHGTLGATVKTDRGESKVFVQRVDPTSDAALIGLEPADELVRFGGRAIASANDFKNRLGVYPSGWLVPMSFRQDEQLRRETVRLMPLHTRGELIEQFKTQPFTPPNPDEKPDDEENKRESDSDSGELESNVLPTEYASLYAVEPGFVNKAANDKMLARYRRGLDVWAAFDGDAGFRISGETADGETIQIATSAKGTGIRGDKLTSLWSPEDAAEDLPSNTGGLLVAIDHLRRFVSAPDEFFTDHLAIGSEPSLWGDGLVDVILTSRGQTSDRWFFDQSDGRLLGFETRISPITFPCTVRLGDVKDIDGATFPGRVTVTHRGREVLEVDVTSFNRRVDPVTERPPVCDAAKRCTVSRSLLISSRLQGWRRPAVLRLKLN